jgi:cytosolic iron-sulfur protein assembly protein CIAO1
MTKTKLELVSTLKGHKDRVWQLSWSPDGEILASCSGDKTVKLWKINSTSNEFECVDTLDSKHNKTIRCLDWSPNGKYLAIGGFDSFITIWKKTSSKLVFVTKLEGHENEVKSVSWSHFGETKLASCSRDKSIWIWEPSNNEGDFECLSVLNGHSQDVKMVKWHPNREILMSSSYDDTLRCWTEDIDDWFCCNTLKEHKSTVWSFDYDKSGDYLASVGDDKNLIFWKLCNLQRNLTN